MKKFQNILEELSLDLQAIDQILLKFSAGKSPLIQEISHHLINSGGKRIRPILLILSAKLCAAKSKEDYHNLAAAVELIHSATLLHDDVVDTSQVRRGKKTANAIWDNKFTILVGDYLFSVAFQLMVKAKNLAVLDLLSKSSSIMADGEVMQLENSNNIELLEEKYFEIIFGKTAVLFSAACESGALVSGATEEQVVALREFGKNLGTLFQIVDDVIDYSSKQEVMGKDLGNDFFEGKVTLPIILTCQKASKEDRKFIVDVFEKNLISSENNKEDFDKTLAIIEKNQGLEACKEKALDFYNLAVENLKLFPDSSIKEDLKIILSYSLERIS